MPEMSSEHLLSKLPRGGDSGEECKKASVALMETHE